MKVTSHAKRDFIGMIQLRIWRWGLSWTLQVYSCHHKVLIRGGRGLGEREREIGSERESTRERGKRDRER